MSERCKIEQKEEENPLRRQMPNKQHIRYKISNTCFQLEEIGKKDENKTQTNKQRMLEDMWIFQTFSDVKSCN